LLRSLFDLLMEVIRDNDLVFIFLSIIFFILFFWEKRGNKLRKKTINDLKKERDYYKKEFEKYFHSYYELTEKFIEIKLENISLDLTKLKPEAKKDLDE